MGWIAAWIGVTNSSSLALRLLVAALAATVLLANRAALADGSSAYCKRVSALADSTAALLYAPRLEVQGVRFPQNGAVDTASLVGEDFQARAALSFSPLDAYKGSRVERVAVAECSQHETSRAVEEVMLVAAAAGRLPALRRAASFLDARRENWLAIEHRAADGLAAQVVSLLEAQDIRSRVSEIERHRETLGGEIARIEALRAPAVDGSDLTTLLRAAEGATLEFERRSSNLRTLDAWEFDITAGAAPDASSTEFFGVAHVSLSFGAWAQRSAERRAIAAREQELRESRTELRDRVRSFRDIAVANQLEVSRAAGIASRRLESLRSMRSALEGATAPKAPFARDVLDLDVISADAEQIFLETWLTELRRSEDVNVDD